MAIDASIYNAFKPETYGQRQERLLRGQAAAQDREFNALKIQQAKAELADKDRMRQESLAVQNALMGATTDDDRISRLTALGTPTAWGQADTLRKGILERQKAEAENSYKQAQADRERLSTTKDKLGLVLNVVSAAKDPVSYQQGLQILQANGVDLAGVPPQFDPKYVANAGQQALTAMQRLEQEWKAKGYDLDVKRQEESVRHNRTQEGLTARGQNMTDARARAQMAQSDAHFNAGMAEKRASGGAAGAATEDERKAAGWLSQAENAWNNMQAVGFAKNQDGSIKVKAAAKPGILESQALLPEGVKNMTRSAERQQFLQASSSLSEALLRAATGAGVNESEAKQKVAELTPQWGDSDAVIQQKAAAVPMYINSLRTRAGRAVPKPSGGGGGVVDFGSLK